MLNIIINYEKNNTYQEILDYITHINNINKNTIHINIYILNCSNKYNIEPYLNENIINNMNVFIYTYNVNYTDSILNDIINNTIYDYILFTKLNVYLTYDFIDWIHLNNIEEDYFIRNNIFELKQLSDKFMNSYDNDIYYNIIENIDKIINENGVNSISNTNFIESFNNITNIKILNSETIIKKSLYYLHNIDDFLMIHKNIAKKEGFNIENNNSNLSYQYFILNLIKKNYNMYILPVKISSYKLSTIYNAFDLINIEKSFTCSNTFNKHINYKIYNILFKQEQSFIRDQIKSYKGYNPTKTISENKYLKNANKELVEKNIKYNDVIIHNKKKIDYYLKNKWNMIYVNYNKLNEILNNTRNKIISLFKIINL